MVDGSGKRRGGTGLVDSGPREGEGGRRWQKEDDEGERRVEAMVISGTILMLADVSKSVVFFFPYKPNKPLKNDIL